MERDVFFRHGHFFSSKKRGGSARFTMVRCAHTATLGGAARERKASGLECMHSWLTFSPPPSPSVCLAVPGIAPSGVRGGAVCGSGRARNGARRASSPARAPACASLSCWPALGVAGEEGVCRCAGRARDRLRFASRAGSADPLCARRCPCARVCRPSARSRS